MTPLTFFLRALTLALVLAGLALVVFGHPGAGLALAVSPLLAVAFAPDPRPARPHEHPHAGGRR